jgi:hypothetical protein
MRDGSTSITTSVRIVGRHASAALHHRFGIPTHKDLERLHGQRMFGPTRGFTSSPEVVPGATVGTLRTGYLHVQASSQDNGSRLPTDGSSEAATCSHGSGSRSSLGAAPGPPHVPAAQGSYGAATCPQALWAAGKLTNILW